MPWLDTALSRCAIRARVAHVEAHKRKGFNLVEAAIVLGVVGLVIGGIWIAAATVTYNQKLQQTFDGWTYYLDAFAKIFPSTMGATCPVRCLLNDYMESLPPPAGWSLAKSGTILPLDPWGNRLYAEVNGMNAATGLYGNTVAMGYSWSTTDRKTCAQMKFYIVTKMARRYPIYYTGWPGTCNQYNTNPQAATVGFYHDNCCGTTHGEVTAYFVLPP